MAEDDIEGEDFLISRGRDRGSRSAPPMNTTPDETGAMNTDPEQNSRQARAAIIGRPVPPVASGGEALKAYQFAANEWADMATNGMQWLKNLKAGIGDPDAALANMSKCLEHCQEVSAKAAAALSQDHSAEERESFQARVQPWMRECFGAEIAADKLERGDRTLEEVLELLQSGGYPPERVAPLVEYVWSRPVGEPSQEVGGVMVTLAAYCLAHGLDMHEAGETELARITRPDVVLKIRAKQAAKAEAIPFSPLPAPSPPASPPIPEEVVDRLTRQTCTFAEHIDRDGVGWSRFRMADVQAALGEIERQSRQLAEAREDRDTARSLQSPRSPSVEEVARIISPSAFGDDDLAFESFPSLKQRARARAVETARAVLALFQPSAARGEGE